MKKLKKWTTLLAVAVFVVLVIPQWTLSVSATEASDGARNGNIASGTDGTDGTLTWVIDANGKLTISGSGDFSDNSYYDRTMPWDSYKNDIKSAVCNVTGMTNARYLFSDCKNMVSVDLSGFDTSSVTNMGWMFSGCSSLISLNVSNFNTSNTTNMEAMFRKCSSLTSLDVSKFNTSNVTNMYRMFEGCSALTSLDVSNFNTSKVTNMLSMFIYCRSLTSLDVSNFDTSNVDVMNCMFEECSSLTSLDVSKFNTSKVERMLRMFACCSNLTSLDVSNFDTSKVKSMDGMFCNCSGLKSLDLGAFNLNAWDISFNEDGEYRDEVLVDCSNLLTIYTPYNLKNSVTLPGTGWLLPDKTEITELPKNLNSSVMITRSLPGADKDDNKDDNSNGADKDNNNQPGSISGVLEGTGSSTDSATYGRRLLTANPTDYRTIMLSWDAVPNAKSYEVFYSTSPDTGFKRLANVKKTSYKFSKAKCGVTYYFQMRVCQKEKVKSEFGPISYGKTDLSSSATLQVKKTTYNSVTLKWSKVTGAKRYEIYYADSMDGDWQYLGVKGGTSFTHKKLVTGATYYYQIRPVRDSFHGGWSNGVSATTVLGNVSNLKVKATGADQMKITWRKVKGANQYVIKRSDRIDGDYEVIGYSGKASYRDTGLKSGTTYFYKVSAVSGPYRTKDTDPVGQTTKIPKK